MLRLFLQIFKYCDAKYSNVRLLDIFEHLQTTKLQFIQRTFQRSHKKCIQNFFYGKFCMLFIEVLSFISWNVRVLPGVVVQKETSLLLLLFSKVFQKLSSFFMDPLKNRMNKGSSSFAVSSSTAASESLKDARKRGRILSIIFIWKRKC